MRPIWAVIKVVPLLWKCVARRLGLVLIAGSFCIFGQNSPGDLGGDGGSSAPAEVIQPDPFPPPPTPKAAPSGPDKRVFGVLPNYRTVDQNGPYQPITAKEKIAIATKDTVDYPLFILGAGLAGLAQLTEQHPNLGEGLKGYSLRYVTAYSDQAVGNMMTEGLLPSLFHEDPRYFRQGPSRGGVWWRSGYAASRIFVTKTDKGNNAFNFSEVLGNSIAAGVGNAYYTRERAFEDNFQRLYVALATDAFSQVLKEFWPDIKQKYFSHHPKTP